MIRGLTNDVTLAMQPSAKYDKGPPKKMAGRFVAGCHEQRPATSDVARKGHSGMMDQDKIRSAHLDESRQMQPTV